MKIICDCSVTIPENTLECPGCGTAATIMTEEIFNQLHSEIVAQNNAAIMAGMQKGLKLLVEAKLTKGFGALTREDVLSMLSTIMFKRPDVRVTINGESIDDAKDTEIAIASSMSDVREELQNQNRPITLLDES